MSKDAIKKAMELGELFGVSSTIDYMNECYDELFSRVKTIADKKEKKYQIAKLSQVDKMRMDASLLMSRLLDEWREKYGDVPSGVMEEPLCISRLCTVKDGKMKIADRQKMLARAREGAS